ncbi:MAG: UDP-glucose/GDP-mannose dehydrogenase family protein [Candidatus Dadabacteria bacterium]|nr:MAG: UDP-glucose/GDP-mannose dehydrogenase family protein [Candidatus Dadabacteria bacterium]
MKICVVGSGYVGLVAGACFAESGNDVICVDVDQEKIEALKKGVIPIYEPGLEGLVTRNSNAGRLHFTTDLSEGVQKSEIIFIAVGTPQDEDGSADLTHVLDVARGIGKAMNGPKIIVDKSTVPVGTAERVREEIEKLTDYEFEVVSNPEFLKEGAAIDDFMKPDRVVIGAPSEHSANIMRELYAPFVRTNKPILVMDVVSAEMTKYAANAMLAARVSFMNEIAVLCEKTGADIDQVRVGIGTDTRIGMPFLFPGIGYGGSCFPKDVQALIRTGKDYGLELKIPTAVEAVNFEQKRLIVKKICAYYGTEDLSGRTFAVWGLAFKPKTDDVREAPALVVIGELLNRGATVKAYDPEAMETFRNRLGENAKVTYVATNYDALGGADALVICTEWNEFRRPDFNRIKGLMEAPVIFDGRNLYGLSEMREKGFVYHSIGRPSVGV